MTREEQIQSAADSYLKNITIDHDPTNVMLDFIAGAEWADASRWISVEDQLPDIPQNAPSYFNIHIIAAWGDGVAEMTYREDIVRGKKVRRFHWHGRLSPWGITHWMPLPVPPKHNLCAQEQ